MALVYTSCAADVQPRVAGRPISTTTEPTTAQVEQWLLEAETAILGTLNGLGISPPASDAAGAEIIKGWAAMYAVGYLKIAWLDEATDGQAMLDKFDALLERIQDRPSFYDAMLNEGSSGESSSRVKGYVLSNDDGKTIADSDFDPIFDEDTAW